MKSSLEIAQEAELVPIERVAEGVGLEPDEIEPYGRFKAKVGHEPDLAELKAPVAVREQVSGILAISDDACVRHLDAEYAQLCRVLVARLSRKRPSPLLRGDVRIWATGAVYAVGQLNFLFDRT